MTSVRGIAPLSVIQRHLDELTGGPQDMLAGGLAHGPRDGLAGWLTGGP